ncbi:MAG: molybdopterin-binding/glycosyltransferase family 2 protein [Pseudomonadota bacterium]
MKFGAIPTAGAVGAILAHSHRVAKRSLKKGRRLSEEDVDALLSAGYDEVVTARLEADDVGEDAAAARLISAVTGPGLRQSEPFTGRCNLFAEHDGLLVVDTERLHEVNFVTEELTVATLSQYSVVTPRQMIATVKVIPFAARETDLATCERIATERGSLIRVEPFRPFKVGLVQTRMASTKESVLDKTTKVLTQRLERLGSQLVIERRCGHQVDDVSGAIEALLDAGVQMVLIAGASAIVDRRDVVPAGIVDAGGNIEHFGMPVDPGNLLLMASRGSVPIIGLPGCARSPKPSGFDFVLQRIAAGIPVSPEDIKRMGPGGLLKELSARPSPRAREGAASRAPARAPKIGAIILAGGQSRRMGADNKLLATVNGKPMLLHAVEAAMASDASHIVVVTGHEREAVEAALVRHEVTLTHNPDFTRGLSTSLGRGISALDDSIEAALVCLGDMPELTPAHLNRLIAGFDPIEGRSICVPTFGGKRGNPVLFARELFPQMQELRGDVGAKHLIGEYEELVCEVEMSDRAVLLDIDSPDELAKFLEASNAG